jgi:hypothetical protein
VAARRAAEDDGHGGGEALAVGFLEQKAAAAARGEVLGHGALK